MLYHESALRQLMKLAYLVNGHGGEIIDQLLMEHIRIHSDPLSNNGALEKTGYEYEAKQISSMMKTFPANKLDFVKYVHLSQNPMLPLAWIY